MRVVNTSIPTEFAQKDEDAAGRRPFEEETARALAGVRKALGALVAAIPGDIRRPIDLQRAAGADYRICWQVFSVLRSETALAAANHVPRLPSLRRMLDAAEALGVSAEVVGAVQTAIQEFNQVVKVHAGDRSAFDAMVAGVSPGGSSESTDLYHRRMAYKSLSHIWGMQVETFSRLVLVRPAASGEGTDECMLNKKLQVRRLRPGVSSRVHGFLERPLADAAAQQALEPIDRTAAEIYGAPLLPEFCSQPVPPLKTVRTDDGWNYSELAGEELGRRSAVDLTFSGIYRGLPPKTDAEGRPLISVGTLMTFPTGLLIFDLAVHRPSYGTVSPEAVVYAALRGNDSPASGPPAQQLPVREPVVSLGSGADAVQTPDVPAYPEMFRRVCAILGWEAEEFDVYRLRLVFPVLSSDVKLQFHPTSILPDLSPQI
jgi:hypothetical protein